MKNWSEIKVCASYRKLRRHDISVQIVSLGYKRRLRITKSIIDTGCIKPIISSILKSVEFLTPNTVYKYLITYVF